jgi:hypothetical protein
MAALRQTRSFEPGPLLTPSETSRFARKVWVGLLQPQLTVPHPFQITNFAATFASLSLGVAAIRRALGG